MWNCCCSTMYPEVPCRVSEGSSVRNTYILVPQYYSDTEQFLTFGSDNPLTKDILLVKIELCSTLSYFTAILKDITYHNSWYSARILLFRKFFIFIRIEDDETLFPLWKMVPVYFKILITATALATEVEESCLVHLLCCFSNLKGSFLFSHLRGLCISAQKLCTCHLTGFPRSSTGRSHLICRPSGHAGTQRHPATPHWDQEVQQKQRQQPGSAFKTWVTKARGTRS